MSKLTKEQKRALYTSGVLVLINVLFIMLSFALFFLVFRNPKAEYLWTTEAYCRFFITFVPGLGCGCAMNSVLLYRQYPEIKAHRGYIASIMACIVPAMAAVLLVGFIKIWMSPIAVWEYALWVGAFLAGAAVTFVLARVTVKRILDKPTN